MFTGIVEEIGRVRSVSTTGRGSVISVDAEKVILGTSIGDSIAVNGICLTVTDLISRGFCADVMPETMSRTNLEELRRADAVNLERAMPVDGRFGGHIVSGHIDCMATLQSKSRDANAYVLTFKAPPSALRYIVEKGSVALNGVSLTVVDALEDTFSVSVIPHTMANTNLNNLRTGSKVNLECDIIAKYVERLATFDKGVNPLGAQASSSQAVDSSQSDGDAISLSFLAENGF